MTGLAAGALRTTGAAVPICRQQIRTGSAAVRGAQGAATLTVSALEYSRANGTAQAAVVLVYGEIDAVDPARAQARSTRYDTSTVCTPGRAPRTLVATSTTVVVTR